MTSPRKTRPTTPAALPLLGHTMQLVREPASFLASLAAHGDLVELKLGSRKVWVACTPELTQRILADDKVFDKGGLFADRIREAVGNGVGTCPHSQHRQKRRIVQPVFHRNSIRSYASTMAVQATAVADGWRDGHAIDVNAEMRQLTTRILVATLLASATATTVGINDMIKDVDTVINGIYRRMLMPSFLGRLPVLGNRRYDIAVARLRDRIGRLAAEDGDKAGRGTLLSTLMSAYTHSSGVVEAGSLNDVIGDECMIFFVAGIAPSACPLAWALHLVAAHPEIEERLHNEASAVLGDPSNAVDDLPRLELANRVVTETLRLYPPGWLLTRVATCDTELGGHAIPAGATVIYSPYVLHHRADLYPEPERFDPDRWDPHHIVQQHRGAFIPFGGGARKCIGDSFAMTEVTLSLAIIAARWRLRTTADSNVRPALAATLGPRRLRMVPTRWPS